MQYRASTTICGMLGARKSARLPSDVLISTSGRNGTPLQANQYSERQNDSMQSYRTTICLLYTSKEELEHFEYKLAKYMYELKAHARLNKHIDKAVALVTKFRNQKPPENATNEQMKEWERKKLTTAKVLATIRKYLSLIHIFVWLQNKGKQTSFSIQVGWSSYLSSISMAGVIRGTLLIHLAFSFFILWRPFLIHILPLLSLMISVRFNSFASINARPVKDVYKRQVHRLHQRQYLHRSG